MLVVQEDIKIAFVYELGAMTDDSARPYVIKGGQPKNYVFYRRGDQKSPKSCLHNM